MAAREDQLFGCRRWARDGLPLLAKEFGTAFSGDSLHPRRQCISQPHGSTIRRYAAAATHPVRPGCLCRRAGWLCRTEVASVPRTPPCLLAEVSPTDPPLV